jgi:ribosome-associated protein
MEKIKKPKELHSPQGRSVNASLASVDNAGVLHDPRVSDVFAIRESLLENKALDVKIYECVPDYFTDYVIVAGGTSSRHIAGMCERLKVKIKSSIGTSVMADDSSQDWVVLDVGFVMVHILSPFGREKYSIEDIMKRVGNRQFCEEKC